MAVMVWSVLFQVFFYEREEKIMAIQYDRIAKEIVELHHGSIDAHKEGKQIVFTIHLWKKLGGKL